LISIDRGATKQKLLTAHALRRSHFNLERLLFLSCTRLHDILEPGQLGAFRGHPEHLQELNLDVSTKELISAKRGFTYPDSYATLGNGTTVTWLTPHAAVARKGGNAVIAWDQLEKSCGFRFSADGQHIDANG
jgi:hypothetical protein